MTNYLVKNKYHYIEYNSNQKHMIIFTYMDNYRKSHKIYTGG